MAFLRRNSALFSLVCASAFMLDAAHAADITSAYTDTGIGSIHFSGMSKSMRPCPEGVEPLRWWFLTVSAEM